MYVGGMIRNAAKSASGNVVYALLQAISLVLIARNGGPTDAALFFLAQAIATPLSLLAGLRLKDRLAVIHGPQPFRKSMIRMAWVSAVLLLPASAAWLALSDFDSAVTAIAILIANLCQGPIWAIQGRRAASADFFVPSQLNSLLGVTSTVAILFGYTLGGGLKLGALAMAGLWAAVALVATARELRVDEYPNEPIGSLSDDLSAGAASMAQVGQLSIVRLGIAQAAGATALAVIGTSSTVVQIGAIVVLGVQASLSNLLSQAAAEGETFERVAELRTVVDRVSTFGVILALPISFVFGPPAISFVFGEDLRPLPMTMALIGGSAVLLYGSMLLALLAIALNRPQRLFVANLIAMAVTAVVVLPLSAEYGEFGGAIALSSGLLARYLAIRKSCDAQSALELDVV